MCFYYSITRQPAHSLIKSQLVKEGQLSLFDEPCVVNGFDHPFMPVITNEQPDQIQHFRWGFLPDTVASMAHADAFLSKYNTLNAKAEEIGGSKLYATAFRQRRCLVLCSGFFEWKQVKKEKIPYYITLKNDELFVFAGVWNRTRLAQGEPLNSYAILTIAANELMASIHNTKQRMPLILSPDKALQWLHPSTPPESLNAILSPLSSDEMKAHTIRKFVPGQLKHLNLSDLIAYYNYPQMDDIMGTLNL